MRARAAVQAAGGVLWRPTGGPAGVEIALVHRPRYDDWSIPKGKLERGEHPLLAACREVVEETGHRPIVGRLLPSQSYLTVGGRKQVHYWSMRHDGSTPPLPVQHEVDAVAWLAPADAARRLSYDHDRALLAAFSAVTPDTTTLLLVRHARAGPPLTDGDDRLRELEPRGRAQAELLAAALSCFRPRRVFSAGRTRCVQTVAPLAARVGTAVEVEPLLGDEEFEAQPAAAMARLRELAALGLSVVACGQGGAIPAAVTVLSREHGLVLGDVGAGKGSTWALSFHRGRLVAADYYPDLGG